jgi:hypothetical protein
MGHPAGSDRGPPRRAVHRVWQPPRYSDLGFRGLGDGNLMLPLII